MSAPPVDPWVEAILAQPAISGRFVQLAAIGDPTRGNFSYVFAATDTKTRRDVVLKFLRPERVRDGWLKYFQRESEISSQLIGNPHFIQLAAALTTHDVEMTLHGGHSVTFPLHYIATERAVRDLDAYLFGPRKRPAALWRRLWILRDVVKAVARLHRLGYCHRDLKPDNIFLATGGAAKLGDLGLCRPLDGGAPLRGDYSQPVGHRLYAAPETFCGAAATPQLFRSADWFSVGAILFETIASVKLYAAIGLHGPLEVLALFGAFGPLDKFETVVGDLAGAYPIPALQDFSPNEVLALHPSTMAMLDSLVKDLCHFDYRRRLCEFERILRRLDIAIARADIELRRNARKTALIMV